jgi:anti-sigma factor RsiW
MTENDMNDEELSALIRSSASRHQASERLGAAVRTQIALQKAARDDAVLSPKKNAIRWPVLSWFNLSWSGSLLGFAGGVVMTLALVLTVPRLVQQQSLPTELVASHVRALKTGPLYEVASSDRHTVKPWFQGKLDYAPPVLDLKAEGFPLLGGRVEQVAGAPVAALAYTSQKHIVNVYVWPAQADQLPQRLQQNGFNLLHWSERAMQVWVVSDLEAGEIERFSQAWRSRAGL